MSRILTLLKGLYLTSSVFCGKESVFSLVFSLPTDPLVTRLPVCRVRPVPLQASLSLRPCVTVILRHALASLRLVLQAAFVAYPGRRKN